MLSQQGLPSNEWSRYLHRTLKAYLGISHSITGMAPDVALFGGLSATIGEALEAGLPAELLEAELSKHAGKNFSSLKVKISHKILVRVDPLLLSTHCLGSPLHAGQSSNSCCQDGGAHRKGC